MKFTAISEKEENGWSAGKNGESACCNFQGKTVEELKENLSHALRMVLNEDIEPLFAGN